MSHDEQTEGTSPRRGGMGRYALRRIARIVPTLLGVTLLAFVLFDVIGGSPAALELGQHATKEQIEEYDRQHGYDRPLPVRYVRCLADLARGDLDWRDIVNPKKQEAAAAAEEAAE